jgi:hypothetical protein
MEGLHVPAGYRYVYDSPSVYVWKKKPGDYSKITGHDTGQTGASKIMYSL